jgi:hypothetical protein
MRGRVRPGTMLLALALGTTPPAPASTSRPAPVQLHLDCMALYALLRLATPDFAALGEQRAAGVRQIYLAELPALKHHSAPSTGPEIDAEIRARMQRRGTVITGATTNDEVVEVTDAFLADLRTCDNAYGFAPLPHLWID